MEKNIYFTSSSWNRTLYSFEFITKLLKSELIDKFDRIMGVGKLLEHYYPGSHDLFLFLTDYKISLPK